MATKSFVYVLSREHYHFPPNDSDMVASTPLLVAKQPDNVYLSIQAHMLASEHAKKFKGTVKEYQSTSPDEYRVWVDSESAHCDKFVWVVRKVEFRS